MKHLLVVNIYIYIYRTLFEPLQLNSKISLLLFCLWCSLASQILFAYIFKTRYEKPWILPTKPWIFAVLGIYDMCFNQPGLSRSSFKSSLYSKKLMDHFRF